MLSSPESRASAAGTWNGSPCGVKMCACARTRTRTIMCTRARMRVLSRPRARAQRMHCSGGTSRTSSPRTLRATWLRPAFARGDRPRRPRPRTRPRIRPQRWRPRRLRPWTRPRLRPLSPLIRPMNTHTHTHTCGRGRMLRIRLARTRESHNACMCWLKAAWPGFGSYTSRTWAMGPCP